MKTLILMLSLAIPLVALADTPPTPTPYPAVEKWNASQQPWDLWFTKNALVTDKTEYVHFFWNAQDFKQVFETKDKNRRLGDAALQLVAKLYPKDAKADAVKVDIVYVLERDTYGEPKWDSLQQVAHFEFSRAAAKKAVKKKALSEAAMKAVFKKLEIF